MRPYGIAIILFVFLAFSCQNVKQVKRPDNLIEEDKMVDILTEVAILNAARNYNKTQLEQSGVQPDTYIYEKFAIDSLQFEKSNNYYSENYNTYVSIYDRVKDSLDALKKHYDSLEVKENKLNDSLRKANLDKNRPKFKKAEDSSFQDSSEADAPKLKRLDSLNNRNNTTTPLRKAQGNRED